jgi:hypothetical protein
VFALDDALSWALLVTMGAAAVVYGLRAIAAALSRDRGHVLNLDMPLQHDGVSDGGGFSENVQPKDVGEPADIAHLGLSPGADRVHVAEVADEPEGSSAAVRSNPAGATACTASLRSLPLKVPAGSRGQPSRTRPNAGLVLGTAPHEPTAHRNTPIARRTRPTHGRP